MQAGGRAGDAVRSPGLVAITVLMTYAENGTALARQANGATLPAAA